MERDSYLLYESIPVMVTIRNFSGRQVTVADAEQRPWLRFSVTDQSSSLVPAVARPAGSQTLTIAPGQTLQHRIDIVPLYELRMRGAFRVQAVIETDAIRAASAPVSFEIVGGREIWKQTRGLPPADGHPDDYRTYAVIIKRERQYDILYVSVRDEPHDLVYGVLPLGTYVALGGPQALIDKEATLHLLFRSGPRSFSYTRIDPMAKILDRAVYSNLMSDPQLVSTDTGEVVVRGGEMTYPRDERPMVRLPVAPTEPPKKKKWWWPFGPAQKSPAANTNAPTAKISASER
jgi:hypothetical protein